MRPTVSLDIESTGTNTATDAIVSIGIVMCVPGQDIIYYRKFKPWKPIPPEVEKIIGITNEEVECEETFAQHAKEIFEQHIQPHDLLGFNINGFDVPILWEEFYRAGIEWDLSKHLVVDVGTLWKKLEERTLESAVRKFLGREHMNAHNAAQDAVATWHVFSNMRSTFPQLKMPLTELAEFSKFDDRKNQITLDGKIVKGPDGDPIYNFGKPKGIKVKDDIGFAYWILGKDFPANTRIWLRNYLDELNKTEEPLW